jgi:dihydrodipicolinate synthase/N-acetylneuraminate lyase
MLSPRVQEAAGNFVSVGHLAGSAAVATAPGVASVKTRTKEAGFQTITGSEGSILASLQAGASGAIVAFACFAPQACQEIYQAWKDHDLPLAQEKQQRITAAGSRIVGELGIAGIKYACDFNGYYGGRPRAPLLGLTARERDGIEVLLAEVRN